MRADLGQADRIAERSKQLGVKHCALLCGAAPALDAATEQERRTVLEDHLKWAEVAEHLQCDFIRVRAAGDGERSEQLDRATKGIGALCDASAKSSVAVLVENITGFSAIPTGLSNWLIASVQRLGLIADFGNFKGDIYTA